MKRHLLLITLLAAMGAVGCDRPRKPAAAPPQSKARTEKDAWTAQEIAADPQGYLVWSDKRVARQITEREQKLAALSTRRTDWEKRRGAFEQGMSDLENIHRRLNEAYQRADDEDRWPLKFADRSLTREKSQAALAQIKRMIQEREPDRKMYQDILAKMDQATGTYRDDIRQLNRLRQKMEADLEQVRLTQDLAKVQELRKAEDQLASMSKAVVGITDDPSAIPTREPAGRVNIDDILK